MLATRFHSMPDGRRIAFRHARGTGPAVVFLPGYLSDMAGSKATALIGWAAARGRECLLLDYSGCGESSGVFAEGTLSRWCEEVIALIERQVDPGVRLKPFRLVPGGGEHDLNAVGAQLALHPTEARLTPGGTRESRDAFVGDRARGIRIRDRISLTN